MQGLGRLMNRRIDKGRTQIQNGQKGFTKGGRMADSMTDQVLVNYLE